MLVAQGASAARPLAVARHSVHRLTNAKRTCAGRIRAEQKQAGALESVDDSNVNEFCFIGPDGKRQKLSLGEKEQLFLEALSSFYYGENATLSDAEFENLKEDLVWSGSRVAVLQPDEQRFLEAQLAFNRGAPIMSDADFDALKARLKAEGSVVAVQGPRCSLRSRRVVSDASVDYVKLTLINVPAALLVLGLVFSIDDLTGFEITKLVELPEPIGIVALWGFLLPTVYVLSASITNLVFKDALILKAPCPNCGAENTVYFGDILTIAGNRKENTVACGECKSQLKWSADTREVELQPAEPPAAAAAK